MAKFIFALTIVSLALVALSKAQEECGVNQVWDDCGTACPNYCHKDQSEPCTLQCVPGCRCADGYVKRTFDSNTCVAASECSSVRSCTNNRIFYQCHSSCPRYCGAPEAIPCTKECSAECYCKPGYVLKSQNSSKCIPEALCPSS